MIDNVIAVGGKPIGGAAVAQARVKIGAFNYCRKNLWRVRNDLQRRQQNAIDADPAFDPPAPAVAAAGSQLEQLEMSSNTAA